MLKTLNMDYYTEGYKGLQINCLDLPIAAAAGYHRYENYFYYCFYIAILINWRNSSDYDWITDRENILRKLGIFIKRNETINESQMISVVKEKINNNFPIVMIVNYYTLFYLETYLSDNVFSHGIVISEYDDDKRVVVIRERLIGNKVTNDFLKGDPFFKFQLTEDQISNIWKESNDLHNKDNQLFYNKIFSIEKSLDSNINNFKDLIEDFINNYSINESQLAFSLSKEDLNDRLSDENQGMFFRRNFYGSITVLFDVFVKAFKYMGLNENKMECLCKFRDEYISFRNILLLKLHANSLRKKSLPDYKRKEYIEKIQNMDAELFSLIKEMYEICNNK